MGKTIFILLVVISAGLAQTSPDEVASVHHFQEVDPIPSAAQIPEGGSFSGSAALASSAPSVPVSSPSIRTQVQEVSLMFTVTDRHGHFVRNLAPSDFTIQDNGEPPARITYFESQSELPLRLAMVIDTSDSVGRIFNDEKRSAAHFLKRVLRPTSDLALIIGFNQEVHLYQELTSDNKSLSHAIRELRGGGDTAIYDAVSAASQWLANVKETQTVRRAIILITDGEDNRSHIKLEEVEELAQRNECAVYVMNILPTDPDREQSDRAMKELSDVTGGTFLPIHSEEGVTIAFSDIEKGLRSQYLMSYKPARTSPDGSFHRLVFAGPKKLRVHHRDGYFAK
jgi:VWFA-related protein